MVRYNERRKKIAASWRFDNLEENNGEAFRFTRSKDYKNLYAFVIGAPESGIGTIETLRISNMAKGGKGIKSISILGFEATIEHKRN